MARSRKTRARAKHGGARAGAGRKRDRLPQAVVERLGDVPKDDPAALDNWVRRALAELVVLQMRGEVSVALAASIRATCGEIRRNLPAAPARPDAGDEDDDDEEDEGPELEEATADGGFRVG